MTQAHIFYSGRVQGVGFRYSVERIATQGRLCGWVRNLDDGRVEIVVEGRKEGIEKFMSDVEQYFTGHIRGKEVVYEPAQGVFKDFKITH